MVRMNLKRLNRFSLLFFILASFFGIQAEEAVIIMQNLEFENSLKIGDLKKIPIDELEIVDMGAQKKDSQGNEIFEMKTDRCKGEKCISGWVHKTDFIPISQFKKATNIAPFEFSSCLGEGCVNYIFHKKGEFNYYYIITFSEITRPMIPSTKCAEGDDEKVVELEKFCSGSGIVFQAGNYLRLVKTNGSLIEYLKYLPDQFVTNRYDSIDYFEALTR